MSESHMQIHISGKQMETGASLREHVEARMSETIEKYFSRSADVNVTFSKTPLGYHCECATHLDSGTHMQASADQTDVYQSFEGALERLAKQLRRYKRRITGHHDKHADMIAPITSDAPEKPAQDILTGEIPDGAPAIIIEKIADWPVLTVGAAIEILEEGEEYVLFLNKKSNTAPPTPSLVHRRTDGLIGWMEL